MDQYYERAKAATAALKAAGYEAEHIERIDVVRVLISGYMYYIGTTPDIKQYGTELIEHKLITYEDGFLQIRLNYVDKDCLIICLFEEVLEMRDKEYNKMTKCYGCIGHITYDKYISYENMWVNVLIESDYMKLNDSIEDLLTQLEADKTIILDSEFNPVEPQKINIKNDGCKLVKVLHLSINHISTITIFGNGAKFIANGKYTNSGRKDLFKYVDEGGEPFALLYDPQTRKAALASSTTFIVLTDANTYLVGPVNGLYNGYEIKDDVTTLLHYRNEFGYFIDFDGKTTSSPVPRIYCFNLVFFAISYFDHKIVLLDMRKPNSGANTKAAAAPVAIAEYNE